MKIYVTNLEGTDHRKKWMQNQLDALEIPFQFVQCIDGREWTEEKIKSVVSPKLFEMHQRHQAWLTRGAMAATQTHVEIIYQNIVDQNVDYTLCLEDDTIVPSNFKQYVKDMYESLVTKQLDGAVLLNYHVHTPINLNELEAVLTVQETTIYKLPEQTKVGSGAAYIMSNQGAKSQVRSQSPIDRIGDWWHTHPDLNIYIVYPQVIETGKFSSTLGYQTSWAFRGLSFFIPKKIKEYIRIRKSKALSTQNIKI